jgi:long-chain acyl-CoA synthetase
VIAPAAHGRFMVRETLLDYFNTVASLDGEYLVYDDGFRPRAYSYRALARAARNFSRVLLEHGIGPGDRVVLWSENRPAWVAAFWACVLRGVAVAPIDERHSPDFLERVARITAAKAILAGDEVQVPPLAQAVPVFRLSALDWESETDIAPATLQPDDTCQILFTSGATAEPKGVVITHRNILANIVPVEREVLKYRKYARPFSPVRFLNLLPLSHMFGQAMALFIPPMIAGTVVFQRSQNPQEIVRQIKARRISVLVSVPKILDVLREYVSGQLPETRTPAPAGEKFWWRWWRYRRTHNLFGWKFWSFIAGGAALDPALEEFWGNLGFAVIQGYGLTETAPIVTLNHPFHARRGTVGKPIAGVQLRIAPDGEVLVRGGNVTSGYYNNPEATREAFEDGWFHTGDIGELDSTGRLMIKGRKKEMIVLADGRNVFPEDVERALLRTPGVKDAAVVGLPAEGGERVHAVLLLDPGADPESAVAAANATLEDHQKVRGYTRWTEPELPRTEGTHKLKRRELRNRLTGSLAPAAAAKARPADRVGELLERWTAGRAAAESTSLDDLGLSSLDRVELLVALEQQLGRPVDEGVFASARTLGDVAALQRGDWKSGPAAAPFRYPKWQRHWLARAFRIVNLNVWLLHLAHVFAWVRVEGRENLKGLSGPVIFASNHQSYFDTPSIFIALPWKWRHRLAPTMRKEFFDAHFHPRSHGLFAWFTNSLNYWLSLLMFNALPIPQHEAGTRQALRALGELAESDGCPLIFPEGRHSRDENLLPFQAGVGMIAARLRIPVVPIRLRGSNRVLPHGARMARPGRVTVTIGQPLHLEGDDYAALARQLEERIRAL